MTSPILISGALSFRWRSAEVWITGKDAVSCFRLLWAFNTCLSPRLLLQRRWEVSPYRAAECNSRGLQGSFFPGSVCMCSQAPPANCYWWWWRGRSRKNLGSGSPSSVTKRWALLTLIVAAAEQQKFAYNWREHWASKKTLQQRSVLILSCTEGRRHCSVPL